MYALDSRTGEITTLFEIPPFPDPESSWDYANALAWRDDGLYFLTTSSGMIVLWRATFSEGEVEITQLREFSGVDTYVVSLRAPYIAYTSGVYPIADIELHLLNPVTGVDTIIDKGSVYADLAFNADGDVLYYLGSASPNVMAYSLVSHETTTVEGEDPIRRSTFAAHNAPLPERFYRRGLIYQP